MDSADYEIKKFVFYREKRKEFYVLVLGEVNQPGYIPITKNNTKLGEVIKSVKGFTSNASLKRSRI